MEKIFGIDISTWQKGYPYSSATNEGVKFAILRAGFSQTKDIQFETHYANAKAQGWGVGAYWYMYATSIAGAQDEARAFLRAIAGKQFDYPLYLDIEDKTLRGIDRNTLNEMVKAFGEIIEGAGYYFGVYSNLDWYRNVISGSELNKKYDWWIACWSTNIPSGVNCGLWQFGGETNCQRSNMVAGVVTDQNWALKDYPSLIKSLGLNGYSKSDNNIEPPKPVEPSQPQVSEVIYTVQRGDTLSKIASKYGTTYQILANYNHIANPNIIFVGQQIKIPNGSSAQSQISQITYTVQKGDTLSKIASKYGTTYQKIASDNGISNPNLIYPGQRLIINK